MRKPLSLFLLIASAVLPARAADWPQFRGPAGNGIAPERGIRKDWSAQPPRLLWKVPLGDDGYAGPSVAGGLVTLVDHRLSKDIVRALDLRTGREIWRYAYEDTGKRLYGFARATPAVSQGRVVVVSRLGKVLCLDVRAGRLLWSRHLVKEMGGRCPLWGFANSPLIDGSRVVLCPGAPGAAVAAVDLGSGKTLWTGGGDDEPGYATPVVATLAGIRQYVVFTATSLRGVDAGTGRLLWRHHWMSHLDPKTATPSAIAHLSANAATPVVTGNTVFITSGYGRGCALLEVGPRRARVLWENTEIQSHFSSPIVAGGNVYCTSDPGRLVCLDLQTGRPAWKQRGFEKGGLAGVDDALIVVDGRTGDVVLVNRTAAAYQELGRFRPLGGESRTAPVIADGRFLVRNRKALACFALK